jgi:hypothetical protein
MSSESAVLPSASEWDAASFASKWTFSVASALIDRGCDKPLQHSDMMTLSQHDQPAMLISALSDSYAKSKKRLFVPRLMMALFGAFSADYGKVVFWTIVESISKIGN